MSKMEKEYLESLKKRLLLLKGNRSIKEFAESLGLPVSTVYYYLNGREPALSFLLRVANRMNVSEEWLLTGRGNIFKEKKDEAIEIEQVLEFLKRNWEKWSVKKRHWFEVHFKQLLPEFEIWLKDR